VRYKCCVCKNFDFCETCEERVGHEHPFIKINKPEQAPKMIVTAINEDEAAAQTQPPADLPEMINEMLGGHHGGRGGWRRHCRGGGNQEWRQVANHWINAAKEFVNNGEETKKGCHFGHQPQCREKSKWSKNRAIVVAKPEEGSLQGQPGEVIVALFEFKNETKWPWKRGCFLGLADRNAKCDLIVSDVPVDFEVRGMQTFKLNVPIQVPANVDTEKGDIFEVVLTFYGPKGSPFGEEIPIKIKVNDSIAYQEKIFAAAIQLTELGFGNFDACVEAVKKAKGNSDLAVSFMLEQNQGQF